MSVTKMGFEGEIYYGVAGSTAGTKITNSRDITETYDTEEASTTVRGTGTSPPKNSFRVVGLTCEISFQALEKSTDTSVAAMKAAAAAGTPVAIRTKAYDTGKGFDGDCNVKFTKGMPYKGEQTIDFTLTTNNELREPNLDI